MDDYDKLKEQYDALREREGIGMNAYQQRSRKTAIYPKVAIVEKVPIGETTCTLEVVSDAIGWVYPAGKLGGECGELQEKLFKILRDDGGKTSDEKREAVKKELGDILWYVAQLATEFGLTLSDVAQANIEKLESRQTRGVLGGSGDNR